MKCASFISFAFVALLSQAVGRCAVINVDTVLGPDHPYHDQTIAVIDGVNPPTNVTILEGAGIGDIPGGPLVAVGLDLCGSSRAHMLGGGISGFPHNVLLHDTSVFRMDAGSLDLRLIEARDDSSVILNGGDWREVEGHDSSRVRVNGGREGSIYSVRTFGDSHAAINSDVHLHFFAEESSTAVINRGDFEAASAMGNSEVLIYGGSYANLGIRASENAIVRIRGIDGIAEERIQVLDSATVHMYGTGLRFDEDVFPNTGPVVVGALADGDPINVRYRLFDQGQIILHEVPEPTAAALLALGAASMLVWRRAHFAALTRSAAKHR